MKDRETLRKTFQQNPLLGDLQHRVQKEKEQDDRATNVRPVPIFSWFVTDSQGLQIARAPWEPSIGANYAYRTYFHNGPYDRQKHFRADEPDRLRSTRMSAVLFTEETNKWVVAVSTPVFDGDEFLGVVGVMVEIGPIRGSAGE